MHVEDGLWRKLDLSARSCAVRLAELFVAQPGPCGEVDQLIACDGLERGIVGEESFDAERGEGRALIADGVRAHASGACCA